MEALEAMGLRPREILGRYPHQLSGGERQRIMLARVYLLRPKLLVADEPVSMLDASLRAMFLDHLKAFRDLGVSCLYITHDLNVGYFIADQILILCLGRMVEWGESDHIVKDPLHPYTQELISSIPNPDPEKRWTGDAAGGEDRTERASPSRHGRGVHLRAAMPARHGASAGTTTLP